MRATWTDSRLDDFAAHTDRRFDEVERRMESGFDRVDGDIRELRGEIGALHRTLVHFGLAMTTAFVGLVAAVLGLVATQL